MPTDELVNLITVLILGLSAAVLIWLGWPSSDEDGPTRRLSDAGDDAPH